MTGKVEKQRQSPQNRMVAGVRRMGQEMEERLGVVFLDPEVVAIGWDRKWKFPLSELPEEPPQASHPGVWSPEILGIPPIESWLH